VNYNLIETKHAIRSCLLIENMLNRNENSKTFYTNKHIKCWKSAKSISTAFQKATIKDLFIITITEKHIRHF